MAGDQTAGRVIALSRSGRDDEADAVGAIELGGWLGVGRTSRLDDVLAALAAQDYPNLRCLFLVSGEPGDLPTRIRAATTRRSRMSAGTPPASMT